MSIFDNLSDELKRISGLPHITLHVSRKFFNDMKKNNLIDFDMNTSTFCMQNHWVILDEGVPYWNSAREIVDHYNGNTLALCSCKLNGAHELWCDQWQPY